MNPPTNQFYFIIIAVLLVVLAGTYWLSTKDQWYWADLGQHAHAPAVNISRSGHMVYVTWLGGRDSTFVDHLLIGGDCLPAEKYKPTAVGQHVAFLLPYNSTVSVWAYDSAVHNYTLINSATL